MDGFDDLLRPSADSLESNPFADPFGKRSGSPDPWSSFSHQPPDEPNPYVDNTATEVATESYANGETSGGFGEDSVTSQENSDAAADPLDSAVRAADEEEPAIPEGIRSPGFKESFAPPTFSQTERIRDEAPQSEPQTPSSPRTASPKPDTPTFRPSSPPQRRSSDRLPTRAVAATADSPTPSGSKAVSPLEQYSSPAVDHSFASLALGGESVGGWQQGSQNAWSNDTPQKQQATDDDDDDDLPIRRPSTTSEVGRDSANASKAPSSRNDNGIQPVFVISVDDPQKVGDPIRSFTMYTVHTRTTSPLYQKSAFSVLRRYSDFLWLYETLSENNPGVVVPPVPEKNPFGRFDDQFVQQRRSGLEKCIQKTANHPVLCKDPDLKMFLESDSFALDIKHRKAEIAHERGGIMATLGQTLAGPRYYETDEWFDRQKNYLDSLESQLRGLVKAIELVSKHRTELAASMGEFAGTVAELGTSDVGKQLSHSLTALADVERKTQDLQAIQAQQDVITIMSTVDEYARLINSVRLAFSSRIRTYHTWQSADADVRRVKQAHERNRNMGRIPTERLGHSLSVIAEAERRALEAKHDFDHASKLIKSEVARFEHERIEDFKDSLQTFLEGMISRQKLVISSWENYQQSLLKKAGGGGPLKSGAPTANPFST